ncbi:WD repeat-containing protein 44 [Chlorella vulgaris]
MGSRRSTRDSTVESLPSGSTELYESADELDTVSQSSRAPSLSVRQRSTDITSRSSSAASERGPGQDTARLAASPSAFLAAAAAAEQLQDQQQQQQQHRQQQTAAPQQQQVQQQPQPQQPGRRLSAKQAAAARSSSSDDGPAAAPAPAPGGSVFSVPSASAPTTGIYGIPSEMFRIKDLDAGKEYSLDQRYWIKDIDTGNVYVLDGGAEAGSTAADSGRVTELLSGKELSVNEFEGALGYFREPQPAPQPHFILAAAADSGKGDGSVGASMQQAAQKSIKGLSSGATWVKASVGGMISNLKASPRSDGGSSPAAADGGIETRGSQAVPALVDDRQGQPVKVQVYRKSYKELTDLRLVQQIPAHQGVVWTMKFSRNGKYLATAGQDCAIRVWEVRAARGCSSAPDVPYGAEAAAGGDSSAAAAAAGVGSSGQLADPAVELLQQRPYRVYCGHKQDVLDLCWSKTQFLLSASMDKTVRLWHISMDECLRVFKHTDFVTAIDFHPLDDKMFLSGSIDGKVRLWNIPEQRVVSWQDVHEMVTAVTYCLDGRKAVVGTMKGKCRFYTIESATLEYEAQLDVKNKRGQHARGKKITGLAFLPSEPGKLLITSNDSRIRASFSPGGDYITCGSDDGWVYVWGTRKSGMPPSGTGASFQRQLDNPLSKEKNSSYECFQANGDIVTVAVFAPGSCHRSEESMSPSAGALRHQRSNSLGDQAEGEVLVTAGYTGEIRIYENIGLPHMDSKHVSARDVAIRAAGLFEQINGAMASSPDPDTVAALDRAIQAGAGQLSALGTRLAALVRSGKHAHQSAGTPFIQQQLGLACDHIPPLMDFARQHDMERAVQALQSCATLPLQCGRALMAILDASSSELAEALPLVLDSQARLLWYVLISADAAAGPEAELTLARFAPPEALLAWLSAAASKVLALNGTSLGRGPARAAHLGLGKLIHLIVCKERFGACSALLQPDAGLQYILVQLLVPLLHATAAAMQLPADRRPAELNWALVLALMQALTSEALLSTFQEQLAAPTSGPSSFAPRLLQTAAQLFAAAPTNSDDFDDFYLADLWQGLLLLLTVACVARTDTWQQQGRSALMPDAARQRVAWQLLQALQRLPVALQMAVEYAQVHETPATVAKGSLVLAFGIVNEFDLLTGRQLAATAAPVYSVVGSLADVPACCVAAGAMVRALPHVAALEALAQPQVLHEAGPEYKCGQLASELMLSTNWLANGVSLYCLGMGTGGAWSAADAKASLEAVWQLHTMVCRAIHCSTAGLAVTHLHIDTQLAALNFCLNSFRLVRAALQGRAANSDAALSGGNCRQADSGHIQVQLLSMCVAHVEAAVVAAACQPPPQYEALACILFSALKVGPAALASSPSVQQTLVYLKARLEAEEAARCAGSYSEMLKDCQELLSSHEPQPGDALELAQAAAARSCAFLGCANLAGEGGPAARQGAGSQRCSKCRVAWYCGTACSHADWRAGHRRMCRVLGAARAAQLEREGAGV